MYWWYKYFVKPSIVAHVFHPSTREAEQIDLYEFEVSLFWIMNSRTAARAKQRDLASPSSSPLPSQPPSPPPNTPLKRINEETCHSYKNRFFSWCGKQKMTSLLNSAILILNDLTNQSFTLSQLDKTIFQTTLKFSFKWSTPSSGFF